MMLKVMEKIQSNNTSPKVPSSAPKAGHIKIAESYNFSSQVLDPPIQGVGIWEGAKNHKPSECDDQWQHFVCYIQVAV